MIAGQSNAVEQRRSGSWALLPPEEAADLVQRAAAGDGQAWNRLVDAYVGLIWAVTRRFRFDAGDAADVTQTTWLRLLDNIDRITDPSRVGAWLATTAKRESLRVLAQSRRTTPVVMDADEFDVADESLHGVDDGLIASEESAAVRAALGTLTPRCQELMRMLMSDPPMPYEEISSRLGMPIGSIGPTRKRCLQKLRLALTEMGMDRRDATTDPRARLATFRQDHDRCGPPPAGGPATSGRRGHAGSGRRRSPPG